MEKSKKPIGQIGGFVTLHVALPPRLVKWLVRQSKAEGHDDISAVVRRSIDGLMERHTPPRAA